MNTTPSTVFQAANSNAAFAHSSFNSFSPAASQLDVPFYPTASDDLTEADASFEDMAYSDQVSTRFPDRMSLRHPSRSISDHRGW